MRYHVKTEKGIKCLLCRHYCNLAEGQTGICRVNMNEGGQLRNTVYGRAAASHVDPVEKKPLYHFLPGTKAFSIGTVGCNLHCPFCQNWQISQTDSLSFSRYITPRQIVESAMEAGCKSIAYTYNEPTVFYPFARDVALLAHENGLRNIFVTNGMESPEVIEDMKGLIDAFNVDLKSFDRDYYRRVLKGSLDAVLDTLRLLRRNGAWLEVTTLVVPGQNDGEKELSQIAAFIADELGEHTPWHISAFYPNYKMRQLPPTSYVALQRAAKAGAEQGLKYIYKGNISEPGITFCPECGRRLIVRDFYSISDNALRDSGVCPYCQTKIQGIWK